MGLLGAMRVCNTLRDSGLKSDEESRLSKEHIKQPMAYFEIVRSPVWLEHGTREKLEGNGR